MYIAVISSNQDQGELIKAYLKSEDYMLKTEQLNKEILLQSQEAEAEEEYLESEE